MSQFREILFQSMERLETFFFSTVHAFPIIRWMLPKNFLKQLIYEVYLHS